MSTVLPNSILTKMNAKDRASLGRAGMTAEEAESAFVAKTEADLQTLIQTMLQRNGVYVVRQRMDKRSNVKIGCPDLLFSVNGTPVAWEVKLPGKKPRPEQIDALASMSRNGWQTAVVTSYDKALSIYRELTLNAGRSEGQS